MLKNSSSQTNGIGLTPKVKALLKDQLENEKLCVDKYTEYASKAQDPQLSQLFNDIASIEQKHYDSIQSMLNGTIPNIGNAGTTSSGTTSGSTGSTSYTSSTTTSGTNNTTSKNSYTSSKSHNYNYPPQSTLTSESKAYNEKQPATAQNPVIATNNIFSGYTGGGGLGSYVNQDNGNSLLRGYENTLHPDDLVVGSGGISYGSYGAQSGGPTYNNSTSTTTGSTNNTSSQNASNTTGTTSSTTSGTTSGSTGGTSGVSNCDQTMCQDLLMTEKHISRNYDITIFECPDTQMRNVLNHIQKEEQEHGDKLYNYMHQKGWY